MWPPEHFLLSIWPWTALELVNHLWQSTVVAGGILVLIAAGRRFSAGTRRALAGLGMLQFALPKAWIASGVTAAFSTPGNAPRPAWSTFTVDLTPVLASSTPAVAAAPSLHPLIWAVVWLAGFVAIAVYWLLHGMRARRRIWRGTQPIPEAVDRRVTMAASRMGLRRRPPCLCITSEFGPGVIGIFSPVILLPRGLEEILEPAEFEAVAIHEIVHWQRRDNLWGALPALFVSLLWFNPVMWLLSRVWAIETEKSCDERVLAITENPEIYAVGIAKTIRQALGLAPTGFAGMATAPVVERIENILAPRPRANRHLAASAAVTAGILFVALGSYTGSFALRPRPIAPIAVKPAAKAERVVPAIAMASAGWAARLPTPDPSVPAPISPLAPAAPKREASEIVIEVERDLRARLQTPGHSLLSTTSPTSQPGPKAQSNRALTIAPLAPQAPTPPRIAASKLPAAISPARPAAAAPQTAAAVSASRPAAPPRIYQLAELDHPPKAAHQALPYYPKDVSEPMQIHADVTVAFVIDPAGRVIGARMRQCTVSTANGSLDFDSAGRAFESTSHRPAAAKAESSRFLAAAAQYRAAALQAVKQWAFSPGKKAAQPVWTAMAVVIGFEHSFSVPSGKEPVRPALFSTDLSRASHASLDRYNEISAGQLHDDYRVFVPQL